MNALSFGRVLDGIGPFNTVWLSAVEILDPELSPVTRVGTVHEVRIAEVWLLPEGEDFITERFLEKATLNSTSELLELCRGDEKDPAGFALQLRFKLLGHFFQRLDYGETEWHMTLRGVTGGEVISVVFGHKTLIKKAQELELLHCPS